MQLPRRVSIGRRLTIVTMLTCGVALLLVSIAFFTYDALNFRAALADEMAVTARIVANNSAAALSLNDVATVNQAMQSLSGDPHITAAAIYDKRGKLFAHYRRSDLAEAGLPLQVEHHVHRFGSAGIEIFDDILLDGELVGTVFIRHSWTKFWTRVWHYGLIDLIMLAAACVVAYLLSKKLQRSIASSISQLVDIAHAVATQNDYSKRAVKLDDGELGRLVDSFNAMLSRIQAKDRALRDAHDALEERVAMRTAELAKSVSLLNATLEATADGVVARLFSEDTVFYNSQYRTMWNMPVELLAGKHATERFAWNAAQTKNPEKYIARIEEIKAAPTAEYFDVIELRDGRVFERYTKPQWIDGAAVGIVGNFRDVTARVRAAAELEKINKQLLESSRQAGMAEVAIGVLHNVGNVLNSVNVSSNILVENTRKSKLASLGKIVNLMRGHQQELGTFIDNDPRGRQIPVFLAQLADHLLAEQQAMLKELGELRNNIDHIKEIVAMQQSYSKVSGIKEMLDVTELVEDSLRLNAAALQRHGVRVVCEFAAVPMVNTEKHKILQILVNLVRNAKYACHDSACADKCLTVHVGSNRGSIEIAISDNGVGIAPENLTRIFGHGFTTRKDGHGFGLHSGALAALELGGTLRAHSAGVGKGATFTLTLPVEVSEAAA